MIKYINNGDNIQDRETGAFIPKDPGNRHYAEYLEWKKAGNTPIPAQPSVDHELVKDEWVLRQEKRDARELAEARAAIPTDTDTIMALVEAVTQLGVDVTQLESRATFETLVERVNAAKERAGRRNVRENRN